MSRTLNRPQHPKWIPGAIAAMKHEEYQKLSEEEKAKTPFYLLPREVAALSRRYTKAQRREAARLWSNYNNSTHPDFGVLAKLKLAQPMSIDTSAAA